MKSVIKLLLWVTGLALVVVIGAAAVLATLDPNDHKDWIVSKVHEKTGRTLKLDGDLALTIYPWLGVELNGVTVGNAPGFGADPFLRFEHFKARIKLLPALREQYEIDTVSLHGAVLNLARNEAGVTNWQDLAAGGEEEAKPLPLTAIVLGGVDIQNMQLSWADAASGARYDVTGLTASTGPLTYGEPITLALSAKAKANKPALDGNLKLDGTIAYDLDAEVYSVKPLLLAAKIRGANIPGGATDLTMMAAIDTNLRDETATISDLKLSVLGTTVEGQVKASRIESPAPAVQAGLKVRGSDLALLFKVLEIEPLAGQLANLSDRSFDLDSAVDADLERGDVNLSNLTLNLLGANIKGDLKATNVQSDTPGVRGRLAAKGPDLPALLRVAGQFQKDKRLRAVADQAARSPQRDFKVDTEFDADMKSGDLSVPALSAELLGAKVTGRLAGKNVQTDKPSFKGSLDASGSDLPLLLNAAGAMQPGSALAGFGGKLGAVQDRSFRARFDFDADMQSGNLNLPAFSAELLGAKVTGRLAGRNVQTDKPSFKGSLDASGTDLPLLLRAAGALQPESALSDYGTKLGAVRDRSFRVKTDFDADLKGGNIDLPALDASALGLTIAGKLAAKNMESDRGSVAGDLNVKGSQLAELLRAVEQPGLAETLQSIELDARISGTRSDLNLKPLQLRAVVAGEQIGKTPAEIALKADTRVNLDAEQLDLAGLSLTGLGLNVSGDVKGNKVLSAPELSGRLNVAPFNLRKVMTQLNQELPVMADQTALSNVALQSQFAASKTGIDLKQLVLALDESNLKGGFSFNNPEQPVVRFGLDIDKIDFDRYLPPEDTPKKDQARVKNKDKDQAETAPITPDAAAAAATAQLPVELLRKLDIQGSLQVGQLKFSKARLSNVKLAVNGKEGAIKMDPVTAQLYQGTYSGNVALDAKGKLPKLTLNSKLAGVEIEPLLKDTQGKAKLRGNGDFSAGLVAAGADAQTMKKTLNGQMSFVFRNGAVKGFNLGKILRGVKQFKKQGDFNVESQEETDFTEITGNPVATNGVIRLDDLAGKSPAFRFSGKGVIADLPRDRIDYTVKATVVGTSKGQGGAELAQLDGITIPIDIKGPRDDPKISPDLGSVMMSLAEKEAKDELLRKLGVEEATGTATQQPATDPKKELLDKALKGIFSDPKQ